MAKDIFAGFEALLEKRLTEAIEAGEWELLFHGVTTYTMIGIQRAVVQIREAIQAQTAQLYGEQQDWDQSAVAKLASDVSRVDQATSAQLEAIHNAQARLIEVDTKIAALETGLANVINHQQETAKLLVELAERIEGKVPAAGPKRTEPHLDSPTAG